MFDFVRRHTKIINILLFIFIVPSFIFFGLEGYSRMNSSANAAVVEYDGGKITQAEWDERHRRESDQIRAENPEVDSALLDSPMARYSTLERMVQERVIAASADKLKLYISDAQLASALMAMPEIAALRDANGKLDEKRYAELLKQQHLTPQQFEANLRANLMQQQVLGGVIGGMGWSSVAQANLVLNPLFERREVQLYHMNPERYMAQVKVDEAALAKFFDAHRAQFELPEHANVEYVMLDLPAVMKSIKASEQDLQTYFEQNKQSLAGTAARRVSHIMIAADASAAASVRAEAKQKAEAVLQEVRKAPQNFAALAAQHSQDASTAKQGGDLGTMDQATMERQLAKAFADAAYATKAGEVSAVVETPYGYHIIKVTEAKGGEPTYANLRAQIEERYKQEQAQKKFTESAEKLSDLAFREPQSLKTVSEQLGLVIHTAQNVKRHPDAGTQGVLTNKNLLAALFDANSVGKLVNTTPVDIGNNQLVVARLTDYQAARQPELAEVRGLVTTAYVAQEAQVLAKADGERRLKEWSDNPASAPAGQVVVTSRALSNLPAPLIDAAMRVEATKLPSFTGVDMGLQGYAVVRVLKLVPADAEQEKAQKAEMGQVATARNNAELLAYYETLKKALKVKYRVKRPTAAVAAASK